MMAKTTGQVTETEDTPLPPAIVIHGLAHAEAALAAAAELGVPVTLISAPSAAGYVGPAWFRAVVEQARAAHPNITVTAVLDCGDMPGHALAALRDGAPVIRFSGDTAAKIADIAAQYGALVIAERPEALDLAESERSRRDLGRACRDWLETHGHG
jgi:hypothetical protein